MFNIKFLNFRFSKKGVASFSSFSLILFLFLILMVSTYSFTEFSKTNFEESIKSNEVLISALSFRSSLIEMTSNINSTLEYKNNLDSNSIFFILNNSNILAKDLSFGKIISKNIPTLGINFCSSYKVFPVEETKFYFNGSCILVK